VLATAVQDRNFADMIDLAARLGGGHVTLQHPEYLDRPTFSRTLLDTEKLSALALQDKEVKRAVTRIVGQTMLSTAADSCGAFFMAVDPNQEDISTLSLLEGLDKGRLFASSRDPGIIIGAGLAKKLDAGPGDKIVYTMTDKNGDIVSGLSRLSGIVRTGATSFDSIICLLPIDIIRESLGYMAKEAIQVALFIEDQRKSDEVALRLGSTLGAGTAALSWRETQPELAGFIAMKVGGAIFIEVLIAILVAAGIFNTLFVSVMERLREFGIMIAIGFSPARLFGLIMMESFWLGLVGLAAGAAITAGPYYYLVATGIDVSKMIGQDGAVVAGIAVSPVISVGIYTEHALFIAIAVFIATMLSGLYPAWRAGRVVPVETITVV